MSDFVLGGIIGGSFTLIASIVSLIVQGYYSSKNTKLQLGTQLELQNKQFAREKEQAITERLISFRSKYLLPLRDKIIQSYELTNSFRDTLNTLSSWYGDPPNPNSRAWLSTPEDKKYPDLVDKLKQIRDDIDKLQEEIDILNANCSDPKLNSLIFDIYFSLSDSFRGLYDLKPEIKTPILKGMSDNIYHAQDHFRNTLLRIEQSLAGVD